MNTNILVALKNVLDSKNNKLIELYSGHSNNRANSMGDALEYYVKDIFCNTLGIEDFNIKDQTYGAYLSYGGNQNNPPDFIIRKGPAVEVKKIEKLSFGNIALNSSYPKDYIYSESTLLKKECRTCEDDIGGWTQKDMIYAIGNIVNSELKVLWLLYGDCYAASRETYEKMKLQIKDGVTEISGVEFSETKELGKVHKVDPLGVTELRIRGMWAIEHPMKVLNYLVSDYDKTSNFQVYTLILKDKYEKLPNQDKENLQKYIDSGILIKEETKIKNPNNPVQYIDAVLYKAKL